MGMDSTKYGGLERFNVALSKKLEEKGIKSVFVYESYPVNAPFVDDLTRTNAVLLVSDSRKHPLKFCLFFAKLILRYRPVLVHAHFTKARFYAIPIASLLGTKGLFFTLHSRMNPKRQIKPLTRMWYGWANRKAKVIAVSENIALTYQDSWPVAQVRKIYLGVDCPSVNRENCRRFLGIPEEQTVLLTVANFNHIKGLDVLVRAIALLVEQNKWEQNACLYVVGQPDNDLNELKSLIDSLGIAETIQLQGITNDVSRYLGAADLYVQPSRSEGLPLSLMEAASHSLSLVGSNIGGIPEIIKDGENGFLVSPEDVEQLANAIFKLMQNRELRTKFGNASYTLYKELFSIEKGVQNTADYYFS